MAEPYFKDVSKIRYEGPESDAPLAFRYYDPARKVLGKSIGAVRVIQYRALGALRRRLEDDFSHHYAKSRAG